MTGVGVSQPVNAKDDNHRHVTQRLRNDRVCGSYPLVGSYRVVGHHQLIASRAGRPSSMYSVIPRRPGYATGPRVLIGAARRLGQARANPSHVSLPGRGEQPLTLAAPCPC
jgi:hypothetical protein